MAKYCILVLTVITLFGCNNRKEEKETQENNNNIEQTNRKEVVEVLLQFQDGYTNRDTIIIDEFLD